MRVVPECPGRSCGKYGQGKGRLSVAIGFLADYARNLAGKLSDGMITKEQF
jgi:hypothetical protein